jgi:hypothetical protein
VHHWIKIKIKSGYKRIHFFGWERVGAPLNFCTISAALLRKDFFDKYYSIYYSDHSYLPFMNFKNALRPTLVEVAAPNRF